MAAEFAKMNGASYVCMVEANRNRGKKSLTYGYVPMEEQPPVI